jgi:hypothetical protein
VGSIGRRGRGALALVVVAVLGANVAVVVQRSSAAATAGLLRTTGSTAASTTTELPPFSDVSVPPAPAPAPAPVAAPVKHAVASDERPGKNIPDKAPVPKPVALTGPIVGKLDGPDIEGYARYDPQTTCDPTPKPGTLALRNLLLSHYSNTVSFGISRACDVGGVSEHKEGRAFDWGANVNNPAQKASVDNFLAQLFATDSYGHKYALARRMGVMYVIWNQQIWGAYNADAGWRPYSGDSPHTDHVHISMSWAGARAETSFWSGVVVPGLPGDAPPPQPRRPGPTPSSTTSTSTLPRRRRPPSSTTTTRPSTTTTSSTWRTTTSLAAPNSG